MHARTPLFDVGAALRPAFGAAARRQSWGCIVNRPIKATYHARASVARAEGRFYGVYV